MRTRREFLQRGILPVLCCHLFSSGCGTPAKISAKPLRQQLRILTYNIHHGEGTDGKLDLERIAAVINSANPDLVALQEVDQNTTRTSRVNQAAELGKLTGMNYVFGKAMDFQGGAYGQAILSRFEIGSVITEQLPQVEGREPRIVLRAEIHLSQNAKIQFSSTHLDHERDDIRKVQAEAINKIFSQIAQPTVLAGDFNATPASGPMKEVVSTWTDAGADNSQPTIPSSRPVSRIDYILFKPAGSWHVLESKVLGEAVASDHRAVLAALELLSGNP
jgi:endonuclease/exonuclease/phosphatase family metal-dependent hydrolase